VKRVGIDIGGTFTDLILVDEDTGTVTIDKVPSTPDDPARAAVQGLHALCARAGVAIREIDGLLHGTTIATNIALTGTGAEVGMITTEGFRDILHIARHKKPLNFSLQQDLPWQSRPLVKRRHRLTVPERIVAPSGDVLVELDEASVRARLRELRAAGVESVAICLLHAYLNPAHERRIRELAAEEFPEAFLSVSHEVLPLYREYERFSTAALNAYVAPKVARYLQHLDDAVRAADFARDVHLMQSSGGLATLESARARPVTLLLSGVVAGLVGGIWAGRISGFENVITLDMGGTSADIGVAVDGELRMRNVLDNEMGGYASMVPTIDVDTIGAGGGSIASVDGGGMLRVGPASAGADPGPACYGRGGTLPTVTDAQLILGRLRPERGLLGGAMALDPQLARAAIEPLAHRLGLDVDDTALAILEVQKFGMTQAIELNSVRRGYDPRDFALVAAGGAGPLVASDIAAELEVPHVVVPPHPGITAATGLLAGDVHHEFAATERQSLRAVDIERLAARYDDLCRAAEDRLAADGIEAARRSLRLLAECRYIGQGYEVRFDAPEGPVDARWVDRLREAFHEAHEREYGHRFDSEVEVITIRVIGTGRMQELRWAGPPTAVRDAAEAVVATSDAAFRSADGLVWLATRVYDRELLGAGHRLPGPAIVEQYDSTTVIPPGFVATVDGVGNLVIDCPPAPTSRDEAPAASTPVLMRVVGGAFASIAKEMAGVLFRMAYSSIIRESEDLGAGLFDRDGNVLAESDSTPMFMGAMPGIVKNVIRRLGDDLHEGDVILHNDPYLGATHAPDAAIVMPIFTEGRLVGFAGASAHLLDIGGAFPGLAVDLVDNWSEGQIWRAVKLRDQGVWQERLWQQILDGTRTPTENRGDIQAMIAACDLASRRFVRLTARYGTDVVLDIARDWIAYSERMLRNEIASVPDGTYETDVGWLDDDGRNRGTRLPVKVAVTVRGDEVEFDLTGSSAEVATGYNCPFEGTTTSAMALITRMVFLDEDTATAFVPQNQGMLAPVSVIAPEGTIFNPRFPRACFARFCQVQRAVDLALRALAPVIPDRVTAGNSAHLHFMSYSGLRAEGHEYWVYLEVNEGSYGGRPRSDGLDTVDCLIANTRNNPIEELEWRFPMRTERYELRDEPCAAGRWRGGVGVVRVNRFLTDTIVTCEGERHETDVPWGIFGGQDGRNASIIRNPGLEDAEPWPSKVTAQPLAAGDALEIVTPSSGGYGDPRAREPERVLDDVLDGLTTIELAAADYGVVIDPASMSIDIEATNLARGS